MSNALIRKFYRLQERDIFLVHKYLSRTPFYSGYWTTVRIEQSIRRNAHLGRGTLLDVGCGLRPYERVFDPYVERYFGLEYMPDSGHRGNRADLCGDGASLPLADQCIDTILCTEVFEHLADPERTMAEFARVLRPGGRIITTAPFFYPVHDPRDFFRYSADGLAAIMERHSIIVEKVERLSDGGVTLAIMTNLYLYDLCFIWTKWLYPIGLLLRPLLLLLVFGINVTGRFLDVLVKSPGMSFNHLTVGRKL